MQAHIHAKNPKVVIAILALSSFCMGVTEFVIAGVLLQAQEFFSINANQAGYLTTAYAIGVVIGAPLLTIPASALNRKIQLLICLAIFALSNLAIFFYDNFYANVLFRFAAGTQHGVFFVIATLTTIQVSPKGKESSNLALMVSGLTISLVSGVPFGVFVGSAFGFKAIFLLIFALVAATMIAAFIFLPNCIPGQKTYIKNIFKALKFPALLKVYTATACSCGAMFVVYTYVGELLVNKAGFSSGSMGALLLLYGIFVILGNLFGGKLADKLGARGALIIILSSQIIVYALMIVTWHFPYILAANLCLMGFCGASSMAGIKMNAMMAARAITPESMDSTTSVNEASFNVGIALASQLGGLVVIGLGVEFNALVAAAFVAPALIVIYRQKSFRG